MTTSEISARISHRKTPPVFHIPQLDCVGKRAILVKLMRGGSIKLKLSPRAWKTLAQIITKAE